MDVEERPGGFTRPVRSVVGRVARAILRWSVPGLVWLGCGSEAEQAHPDSSIVESDSIAASLIVQVAPETVGLVFQVTNVASSPIEVLFPSHQRFDFMVYREGQSVWTWSADKLFAQEMLADTLSPQETWRFEASWGGDRAGAYEAQARLTSSSLPIQATADFQLP